MKNRQIGYADTFILLGLIGLVLGLFFVFAIRGISTEAGYESVLMDKPRVVGTVACEQKHKSQALDGSGFLLKPFRFLQLLLKRTSQWKTCQQVNLLW